MNKTTKLKGDSHLLLMTEITNKILMKKKNTIILMDPSNLISKNSRIKINLIQKNQVKMISKISSSVKLIKNKQKLLISKHLQNYSHLKIHQNTKRFRNNCRFLSIRKFNNKIDKISDFSLFFRIIIVF